MEYKIGSYRNKPYAVYDRLRASFDEIKGIYSGGASIEVVRKKFLITPAMCFRQKTNLQEILERLEYWGDIKTERDEKKEIKRIFLLDAETKEKEQRKKRIRESKEYLCLLKEREEGIQEKIKRVSKFLDLKKKKPKDI
jgi:predicted transposase YdaD